MPTWVQTIISLLQGLLTPAIGLLASYIAWQQWKTNRQKFVLDRYDRRLRIYEEVRKILSIIIRDAGATTDELLKFRTSVAEADFLFGSEIPEYIDQVYERGLKLWMFNEQRKDRDKPDDYDSKKVAEGTHAELQWLTSQFEPAKEKFRKYLDVSE